MKDRRRKAGKEQLGYRSSLMERDDRQIRQTLEPIRPKNRGFCLSRVNVGHISQALSHRALRLRTAPANVQPEKESESIISCAAAAPPPQYRRTKNMVDKARILKMQRRTGAGGRYSPVGRGRTDGQ